MASGYPVTELKTVGVAVRENVVARCAFCTEYRTALVTVVAVVNRERGNEIVMEAARRADDLETDLHVVFVLGLSWLSAVEVRFAERLGIPVGTDVICDRCAMIAERIAGPLLDDDEYEAVGLVGEPVDELRAYIAAVDADCLVVDGTEHWNVGPRAILRDQQSELRDEGVPVIPVY